LIRDLSQEVATQRAGIAQDIERTGPGAQELLSSAEKTLDAGTRTAQAIESMARAFRSDDAEIAEEDGDADTPPPGKPFDPDDYTALAVQTTRVLEELNTATRNADATLPAVRQTIDDAGARVDASVDRAFGHAVRLILIAAGAVVAVVVLLRFVPGRRANSR
jgi:hypothetical protein